MKIFKIGLPIILVLVMFGTLGAGFANAQTNTCTVRAAISADEAAKLTGTGRGAISASTELSLVEVAADPNATPAILGTTRAQAGENGLLCTFGLIKFITNIIFLVVLVISVLMLAYSSFLFVTAGARPDQVGSAKNVLVYAIVGLVVAALARVLPTVVQGIIGI